MIGFLDNLCGARHSELKVNDPDKLGFDPRKLVSDIASVIVSVWLLEKSTSTSNGDAPLRPDSFISSIVQHPDYSRPVMTKVNTIIQKHQLCGAHILAGFTSLLEKVSSSRQYVCVSFQIIIECGYSLSA